MSRVETFTDVPFVEIHRDAFTVQRIERVGPYEFRVVDDELGPNELIDITPTEIGLFRVVSRKFGSRWFVFYLKDILSVNGGRMLQRFEKIKARRT